MNTKLAVQNTDTTLAHPVEFVDIAGFDQLGPDDFSLPRLVLVQSQHVHEAADKHIGEWYRTDTNEHVVNPRLLIIGIAKSRVLFEEGFDRQAEPICRSDNGFAPRHDMIGANVENVYIPTTCANCPFNAWGEDGIPPRCSLADNWAALIGDGEPIVFRLKGTSAKISKQLKNVGRVARAKRKNLYVELGSVPEVSDQGKYYVASFRVIRDEVPADLLQMAQEFAGINLASRAAEMVDVDATVVPGEVTRIVSQDELQNRMDGAPFPTDDDYRPDGDEGDVPF